MKCPQCQTENRDSAKFCDECGFPLVELEESVPPIDISLPGPDFIMPPLNPTDPTERIKPVNPVADVPGETSDASEGDSGGADADTAGEADDADADTAGEADTGEADAGKADGSGEYEEEDGSADDGAADTEQGDVSHCAAEPDDDGADGSAGPVDDDDGDFGDFDEELYRPQVQDEYFGAFDPELYAPLYDDDYVDDGTDRMPVLQLDEDGSSLQGAQQARAAGAASPYADLSGFEVAADGSAEDRGQAHGTEGQRDGNTLVLPRVDADEDVRQKAYLASSAKKRISWGKVALGILLVLAALGAAGAFATYRMELWGGKSVPDVTDLTQADATELLAAQGFSVRATQMKSDDTEGLVKVIDPEAGSRIPEGSEVTIHITAARFVPNALGRSEQEALDELAAEGFVNVSVQHELADAEPGTVIAMDPAPGERAKSTTSVVVTVSDPFTVPDVSNMYLNEAQERISAAGLEWQIVYVYTDDGTDGYLIGTDPAAGTQVKQGSLVSILISRSRANELEAATQMLMVPGSSITIQGFEFQIESLDYVEYLGSDTTTYTVTGRPIVFGIASASMQHSGSIVWNSANEVVSIS